MHAITALVTGATRRVGRQIALALAARDDVRLVVHGRDPDRLARLQSELEEIGGLAPVVMRADLRELAQARRLAGGVVARFDHLDAVFHCAVGRFAERVETAEGFEATWAVNHLSRVVIDHVLLDRLRGGGGGRVVSVLPCAPGSIDLDDVQSEAGYAPGRALAQSARATALAVEEMARRLGPGSDVAFDALVLPPRGEADDEVAAATAAAAAIRLAMAPSSGPGGGIYEGVARWAGARGEAAVARRLYEESARAAGVEALPAPG